MKVGDMTIGEHLRSPRAPKKIYVVRKKLPSSSVLVWRVDPVTGVDMKNDFLWLRWDSQVEKVSL